MALAWDVVSTYELLIAADPEGRKRQLSSLSQDEDDQTSQNVSKSKRLKSSKSRKRPGLLNEDDQTSQNEEKAGKGQGDQTSQNVSKSNRLKSSKSRKRPGLLNEDDQTSQNVSKSKRLKSSKSRERPGLLNEDEESSGTVQRDRERSNVTEIYFESLKRSLKSQDTINAKKRAPDMLIEQGGRKNLLACLRTCKYVTDQFTAYELSSAYLNEQLKEKQPLIASQFTDEENIDLEQNALMLSGLMLVNPELARLAFLCQEIPEKSNFPNMSFQCADLVKWLGLDLRPAFVEDVLKKESVRLVTPVIRPAPTMIAQHKTQNSASLSLMVNYNSRERNNTFRRGDSNGILLVPQSIERLRASQIFDLPEYAIPDEKNGPDAVLTNEAIALSDSKFIHLASVFKLKEISTEFFQKMTSSFIKSIQLTQAPEGVRNLTDENDTDECMVIEDNDYDRNLLRFYEELLDALERKVLFPDLLADKNNSWKPEDELSMAQLWTVMVSKSFLMADKISSYLFPQNANSEVIQGMKYLSKDFQGAYNSFSIGDSVKALYLKALKFRYNMCMLIVEGKSTLDQELSDIVRSSFTVNENSYSLDSNSPGFEYVVKDTFEAVTKKAEQDLKQLHNFDQGFYLKTASEKFQTLGCRRKRSQLKLASDKKKGNLALVFENSFAVARKLSDILKTSNFLIAATERICSPDKAGYPESLDEGCLDAIFLADNNDEEETLIQKTREDYIKLKTSGNNTTDTLTEAEMSKKEVHLFNDILSSYGNFLQKRKFCKTSIDITKAYIDKTLASLPVASELENKNPACSTSVSFR